MDAPTHADAGVHSDDHAPGHDAGTLAALPPIDTGGLSRVAFAALVFGGIAFAVLSVLSLPQADSARSQMGLGSADGHGLRDITSGYAVGFVFWASLPLGAASLLMLAYLTSASWGVVLRRCFQAATRTMPVLALLFCPLAASLYVAGGDQSPYWWTEHRWHGGDVATIAEENHLRVEAVIENQHKIHDYLNPVGFILRTAAALTIMGVLSYFLNSWGRASEERDDPAAKTKLFNLAGPGVILWVLTMTVMATDWVMSVEPTWASSMFPVVFGMNMFLTTFAFCILVFYSLNLHDTQVMSVVKDKFRIDMGSLMMAFTMVWAYASFSQYMLIWAGNLPEEATYYLKRGNAGWEYLAYFLMAFHWLVPFVVLLFREVKTNPRAMRVLCVLLLAVCVADVIWWMLPAVYRPTGGLHVPLALAGVVTVGGAWGLAFARELGKRPVLPANSDGQFLAGWGHH